MTTVFGATEHAGRQWEQERETERTRVEERSRETDREREKQILWQRERELNFGTQFDAV